MALATLFAAGVLAANIFVLPAQRRAVSRTTLPKCGPMCFPRCFSPESSPTSREAGLTFHMRARAENGDLLGVVVRDERENKNDPGKKSEGTRKRSTRLLRSGAKSRSEGGRAQMDLHDGQIMTQQAEKPSAQFIAFHSPIPSTWATSRRKAGKREPRIGEFPERASFTEQGQRLLHQECGWDRVRNPSALFDANLFLALCIPCCRLSWPSANDARGPHEPPVSPAS